MTRSEPPHVVLLTAWHLRPLWAVPRLFRSARRLEQDCRLAPGCLFVHRWLSKRSILIESRWPSSAAANNWLASERFRRFDASARAIAGTNARIEMTGDGAAS